MLDVDGKVLFFYEGLCSWWIVWVRRIGGVISVRFEMVVSFWVGCSKSLDKSVY